ncbi:MAG TPA: condensation domain-containing protein, partial [Pyrinomonadaceae bacterium]|nr:condensation domain-containing protein [Pyrinomonadaceae bacterium]
MSELAKRLDALSPEKLALLSKRLKGKGADAQKKPQRIERRRDRPGPLSLAQQRLWFLSQLQPDSSFYNMAGAMRLAGDLDAAALEKTLDEIARRHEVLRTSFPTKQGRPVQVVAPAVPRPLRVEDLSGVAEPGREARLARLINEESERPFDLAEGPLYRATLFRLAPDEHVLLVVMHHIVGDGWS